MITHFSWRAFLVVAGFLSMLQAFPVLPVRDAALEVWPAGYHLQFPPLHLLFTPFTSVADYLTVLSVHEHVALLVTLILLFVLIAGIRRGGMLLILWIVFLAWGALVPRPMARLVASEPDTLLIDFHSHTEVSHDGRPGFSALANMRWHQKQGYGAAFITDHNRQESAVMANEVSKLNWRETGYRSLMGEEISLHKTHLVLLGNKTRVDNQPYDSDIAKIPVFLKDMHKQGYVVIASLPEYWFYHWGPGVDDFVKWGIGGFEIVNSAPKALDFPADKRRQIVALCQKYNLPMTGISDTHGYGSATAAWNAMQIPGWQNMDPDNLERAVLSTLKTKGFHAVSVLERSKYWPQNNLQVAFSAFPNFLIYARSLTPIQRFSWIGWLVIFVLWHNRKTNEREN